MKSNKTKKLTMETVMSDPKNRGYHVVIVAGKLFKARTGEGAATILRKLEQLRRTKNIIPEVAYIPNAKNLTL